MYKVQETLMIPSLIKNWIEAINSASEETPSAQKPTDVFIQGLISVVSPVP